MEIITYIGYGTLPVLLIFYIWYHYSGRASEDEQAIKTRNLFCYDKPIVKNNEIKYTKVLYDDFKGLKIFTPRSKDKYIKKIEEGRISKEGEYQRILRFRKWNIDKLNSYFSDPPYEDELLLKGQINHLDDILISLNPEHQIYNVPTSERIETEKTAKLSELEKKENSQEIKSTSEEIENIKKLNFLLKNGLDCDKLVNICISNGKFKWETKAPCKDLGHLIHFLWKEDLFIYDELKSPAAEKFITLFKIECTPRRVSTWVTNTPKYLEEQFRKLFGTYLEVKKV